MLLFSVFFLGCDKEDEPEVETKPTISSSTPANEATDVALDQEVVVTFSEEMETSSITSTSFILKHGTTGVLGTVTYSGLTATFVPAADLQAGTVYTAQVTTDATSEAGVSLANNHTFSFTTVGNADSTAPAVSETTPLNNSTDVAIDQAVVVTFSEAMKVSSVNTTTFTLSNGITAVAGAVDYTGMVATFTPSADLEYSTLYTALITVGATDTAGNALAGIHTFSFTTLAEVDLTAPEINATHPIDNAIDVSRNQVVSLTFSEEMDASSISTSTFTLSGGSSVSGTVDYSGTTATFSPDNMLAAGVLYTATITTGVTDLAGNALAENTEWTFTTGGSATGLEPVGLGTSANYVILAKTAINNSSTSAITGDLGLSPAATSYITGLALTAATGYATSAQVTGNVYAADMADPTPVKLTTAVENMITAYNDAAGRPSPDFLELATGNIGGKTLIPGLYKWTSSVTMPANVVISGGENDIWIFQISGDLSMSAAVNITLSGGAQAKNIFWQVAGGATFGTTSHFEGIILSKTGITFQTGATLNGRALAQTAVILDSNVVTNPD